MKILKNIIIIIVMSVSGAIFIGVVVFGTIYSPTSEITATPALAQIEEGRSALPGHPSKFYIPTLNINTNIQEVGITQKGNIATPRVFSDVGWYKYGTLPGDNGTAVIDGHVDNGLAFPAVFSNLNKIKIGDNIYIETKENKVLNFVVNDIKTYDYNAGTQDIITESSTPRLVLITCTGNWIPNLRTHDKRLVITTVLAS